MNRWEYCELKELTGTDHECELLFYSIGERPSFTTFRIKKDTYQGDTTNAEAKIRTIASLGRDGWELVNIYVKATTHWIFKRPWTHIQSIATHKGFEDLDEAMRNELAASIIEQAQRAGLENGNTP